jgi:hypothetical protein
MEPAIPSGAEVRLRCGEGGGVGDIVARRQGTGVLVHRVVARSDAQGWTLTRGDACWLPDVPLRGADAPLGRVSAVDGAAPPPSAPASLGQRVLLWPLVAALRVHPASGAALVRGLVHARRVGLRAVTPLRRWLSGRPASPP